MKPLSTINRMIEIGLRFIGLWPDTAYGNVHWLISMTTIAAVQYYQYAYILAHFDLNNLSLLMDCLSLTLAYTLSFLKFVALWWNRRIFFCILTAMDRDWKECAMSDSYMSRMMSMANLSRRFTNMIFSIYVSSAFLLSIGEHLLQSMNDGNRVGNHSRELPIKMKLPFEVSQSPIFECFLVGQFIYDVWIAIVVGMVNALLISLILHVSGQIDIMRQDLIEISSSGYDPDTSLAVTKSLIHRHQKIINLSENIDNLFSNVALMQILWNTLVICCTGFVIIIVIGDEESIITVFKSASFYIAITLEAFIFCFAGEFLSAKSRSISDAVYESFWYDMTPADSRIFLFVMLRSQKRLTITAGKIVDLSLEGFTSIMKASASYISVLNAMY